MRRPNPDPPPAGLEALEARLREDLEFLELPAKPWVLPRRAPEGPVADVAILGGGMCGLAAAAALRLLGIDNIRVCWTAPPPARKAPGSPSPGWKRCARPNPSPARRWDCRR